MKCENWRGPVCNFLNDVAEFCMKLSWKISPKCSICYTRNLFGLELENYA